MTDDKKKGDFDQWQREDEGGDKKQDNWRHRTGSRSSQKQQQGHGGRD